MQDKKNKKQTLAFKMNKTFQHLLVLENNQCFNSCCPCFTQRETVLVKYF